jgi:hypothetical protein
MKLLTPLHIATACCIFTSMHAKQLRSFVAEPKTFVELVNFVKTSPTIWDTTTSMLSEKSIGILKKGAQTARLDNAQFNVILDMTSTRIPFTGNVDNDKKYALNYAAQKEDIVKDYPALINPDVKPLQEEQKGLIETPGVDQNALTQFITELIEKNAEELKSVFIDQEILYQRDTADAISPLMKELKEKYSTTEAQKVAKPIFINKLKEIVPGISEMRWEKIEDFLYLNLP